MSNHAYRPPAKWRPSSLPDNVINGVGTIALVCLAFYLTARYGLSDKWVIAIILMGFPSLCAVMIGRRFWSRRSLWTAIVTSLPLQIAVIIVTFWIVLAPFRDVRALFSYPFAVIEGALYVGLTMGLERRLHRRQQTLRLGMEYRGKRTVGHGFVDIQESVSLRRWVTHSCSLIA